MKTSRFMVIVFTLICFFITALPHSYAARDKKVPTKKAIKTKSSPSQKSVQGESRSGDGSRPARLRFRPVIRGFNKADRREFYKLGSYGGSDKPAVIFSMTDKIGLKSYQIRFNGHTVHSETLDHLPKNYSNRAELNLHGHAPSRSGLHVLALYVYNIYGNFDIAPIGIKVDIETPTIVSFSPKDGETVFAKKDTTDITWNIKAEDDFSGIDRIEILGKKKGERNFHLSGMDRRAPYSITINDVEIGQYLWLIQATDKAGIKKLKLFKINVLNPSKPSIIERHRSRLP